MISTLPSSVNCRRRSFRSTISSNRVRCGWNASIHRSGVGDRSRRCWKTRRGTRTVPSYWPRMTLNSTASRSGFQRASSGNVKKTIATSWGVKASCSLYVLPRSRRSSNGGDAVTMATQGERIAGFILITGIDRIRYAVRQHGSRSSMMPTSATTRPCAPAWRCRRASTVLARRGAGVVRFEPAICISRGALHSSRTLVSQFSYQPSTTLASNRLCCSSPINDCRYSNAELAGALSNPATALAVT